MITEVSHNLTSRTSANEVLTGSKQRSVDPDPDAEYLASFRNGLLNHHVKIFMTLLLHITRALVNESQDSIRTDGKCVNSGK